MKLLFVVCLSIVCFQNAQAFLYHDWYDKYDYDEGISPWCKSHLGQIAQTIKQKVTPEQLETMDRQLLECLVEQKILGYIIKDSPPANKNQMNPMMNGMVNGNNWNGWVNGNVPNQQQGVNLNTQGNVPNNGITVNANRNNGNNYDYEDIINALSQGKK